MNDYEHDYIISSEQCGSLMDISWEYLKWDTIWYNARHDHDPPILSVLKAGHESYNRLDLLDPAAGEHDHTTTGRLRTPGNPQPRLVLWGSPWTSWLHLVQVGKISQTLHLAQFRPWNHARAKSSLLTSSGCDPQLFCTTRSQGRVWSKICLVASIHSRMGINRTMRISTWSQPLHIDVVASPKSEWLGWVLTHKTRFFLCVGPFPNTLVNRIFWVRTKAAHLWNHQTSFDASVCFRFTVRARHWQHTQIAAPGTFHVQATELPAHRFNSALSFTSQKMRLLRLILWTRCRFKGVMTCKSNVSKTLAVESGTT